jgi:hypothetical protein
VVLGTTPEPLEKDAYMPHTAMTRLALERKFGNEWRFYQQSKTT